MLSVVRCSTGMAGCYYTKDDYYLKDVGTWSGSLAKELKLSEVIQEQDFRSLVEGKIGEQELTGGGKDNKHTAGVDLTFSAPKSVSILGGVASF